MDDSEKMKTILLLDKHTDIYLPNEIFSDFISSPIFDNWQQQAFAYAYYYLSCFLYRNCIYSKITNISDLTFENIRKTIFDVQSRKLEVIYKTNGILDRLGYTCTDNDVPVYAVVDDEKRLQKFETLSEFQQINKVKRTIPTKFQFKFPVKAFFKKDFNSENKNEYDGHFFHIANTHKIKIETFIACISNPKLSYKGFYLYGFYRRQSDFYQGGYNATIEQIQEYLPISKQTMIGYNNELEAMKLITKTGSLHKPNTYKAKKDISNLGI